MPRPRFDKASPELKEAILRAARREFAQAGYERASLNRILEAAGLSKGAFYYYFDDKADLAATVLMGTYAPLLAELEVPEHVHDAAEFWHAVKVLQDKSSEYIEGSREAMELVSRLGTAMMRTPELAQKVMPSTVALRQKMTALWKRGQELGAVRDDVPVELLMAAIQAVKETIARATLPHDRAMTSDEVRRFADLVWSFVERLCAPAPPPGARELRGG